MLDMYSTCSAVVDMYLKCTGSLKEMDAQGIARKWPTKLNQNISSHNGLIFVKLTIPMSMSPKVSKFHSNLLGRINSISNYWKKLILGMTLLVVELMIHSSAVLVMKATSNFFHLNLFFGLVISSRSWSFQWYPFATSSLWCDLILSSVVLNLRVARWKAIGWMSTNKQYHSTLREYIHHTIQNK